MSILNQRISEQQFEENISKVEHILPGVTLLHHKGESIDKDTTGFLFELVITDGCDTLHVFDLEEHYNTQVSHNTWIFFNGEETNLNWCDAADIYEHYTCSACEATYYQLQYYLKNNYNKDKNVVELAKIIKTPEQVIQAVKNCFNIEDYNLKGFLDNEPTGYPECYLLSESREEIYFVYKGREYKIIPNQEWFDLYSRYIPQKEWFKGEKIDDSKKHLVQWKPALAKYFLEFQGSLSQRELEFLDKENFYLDNFLKSIKQKILLLHSSVVIRHEDVEIEGSEELASMELPASFTVKYLDIKYIPEQGEFLALVDHGKNYQVYRVQKIQNSFLWIHFEQRIEKYENVLLLWKSISLDPKPNSKVLEEFSGLDKTTRVPHRLYICPSNGEYKILHWREVEGTHYWVRHDYLSPYDEMSKENCIQSLRFITNDIVKANPFGRP